MDRRIDRAVVPAGTRLTIHDIHRLLPHDTRIEGDCLVVYTTVCFERASRSLAPEPQNPVRLSPYALSLIYGLRKKDTSPDEGEEDSPETPATP